MTSFNFCNLWHSCEVPFYYWSKSSCIQIWVVSKSPSAFTSFIAYLGLHIMSSANWDWLVMVSVRSKKANPCHSMRWLHHGVVARLPPIRRPPKHHPTYPWHKNWFFMSRSGRSKHIFSLYATIGKLARGILISSSLIVFNIDDFFGRRHVNSWETPPRYMDGKSRLR